MAPRIALFTHDTFGLGHVRRSLRVLGALAERAPEASLLLVTGSPALPALGALPPHADLVKIPTLARTGAPESRPPHLPLAVREVTALRRRLAREAVLGFGPDVLLVDNFPLGARRELAPLLEALRGRPTSTVLGLRDVLDHPETVRAQWAREGVYDVLDRLYDRVLVYGAREVVDAAEAYTLPESVAAKLRYCGYVTEAELAKGAAASGATGPERPATAAAEPAPSAAAGSTVRESAAAPAPEGSGRRGPARAAARTTGGAGGPRLLATVGGGGDGTPLLRAFLGALERLPGASARIVTGPLMPAEEREALRALAARAPRAELLASVPDLPAEMAAADAVVAMAGYNTVAELLALGRPAVLVPRTWRYGEHARGTSAGEEGEQLLRARALERAGLAVALHPEDLAPDTLAEAVTTALRTRPRAEAPAFDLGGRARVADALLDLACEARKGDRRVA